MPKLSDNAKLMLATALVVALGGVAIVVDAPAVEPVVGEVRKVPPPFRAEEYVDIRAYNDAIRTVRDEDPSAVDLLSAPVEPGAELDVDLTIARGARTSAPELAGPAIGRFEVLATTYDDRADGTLVTYRVRNTSAERSRFVALTSIVVGDVDAGVTP